MSRRDSSLNKNMSVLIISSIIVLFILSLILTLGFLMKDWPPIFPIAVVPCVMLIFLGDAKTKIDFIPATSTRIGNAIIIQATDCPTLIMTDIKFLEGDLQIKKTSNFNIFGVELGPKYEVVKSN